MSIKGDVRHAVKMMGKKGIARVLVWNFVGGYFGPWGSAIALTWTVGYVASKSKEVDYTDPALIKLALDAHTALNKVKKGDK